LVRGEVIAREPTAATDVLKGRPTELRRIASTTAGRIAPNLRERGGSTLGAHGPSAPRLLPTLHPPPRRRTLADVARSGVATMGRAETALRPNAAAAVGTASAPGGLALIPILAGGIELRDMVIAPATSTGDAIAAGAAVVSGTDLDTGRARETTLRRARDVTLLLVTQRLQHRRPLEAQPTPHSRPLTCTCLRLPSPPLPIRCSCIGASSVRTSDSHRPSRQLALPLLCRWLRLRHRRSSGPVGTLLRPNLLCSRIMRPTRSPPSRCSRSRRYLPSQAEPRSGRSQRAVGVGVGLKPAGPHAPFSISTRLQTWRASRCWRCRDAPSPSA
jgi:hypothetical protein